MLLRAISSSVALVGICYADLSLFGSGFETKLSFGIESRRKHGGLPFDKIIAFGDDFVDNGQGSYAHGITGNPTTGAGAHMWGANTFTDGLVAVSYLAQNLGIPLTYDYAFGSSGGADKIGSICDNRVIPASKWDSHAQWQGSLVPSALEQVKNYTSNKHMSRGIDKTLHFFWTGNNDMIASLGWTGRFTICTADRLCVPSQERFVARLITCFQSGLTKLAKAGANYILVPNIYPRNLSPWTTMWISQSSGMISDFGSVIDEFNSQLEQMIDSLNQQYGTNIMYYDVNAFIQKTLNNANMVDGAGYTFTCVDGCTKKATTTSSNWDLYWNHTVVHHEPDLFYWMTEIMPSTTVHEIIAGDMFTFLSDQNLDPVKHHHRHKGHHGGKGGNGHDVQ